MHARKTFGVILAYQTVTALIAVPVFAVFFLVFGGRVSVGSLAAALSLPFITWFQSERSWVAYSLYSAIIIIVLKHRSNTDRLLRGTEPSLYTKNGGTPLG